MLGNTQVDQLQKMRHGISSLGDHEDMNRLFDSLMTLGNVVNALNQHPKFWKDRSMDFTPAGKIMETLSETIDRLIDDVVKRAASLPANNVHDRNLKALTIASWEAFCNSTPSDIIAAIAPLATDTH